jgi:KamA family protein
VPSPLRYRAITAAQLERLPQLARFSAEAREQMRVVASVLPFRSNSYVCEQLIDWQRVPDDPLFRLNFPDPGMLPPVALERLLRLHRSGAGPAELEAAAQEVRATLNPHPGGQWSHNVPWFEGERLSGLQHKYRETVLYFPSAGQTCHAYCTFCFRWAQFVGDPEQRFAEDGPRRLHAYLAAHREVSDLLVTGGDPLVQRSELLARDLLPLLESRFEHLQSIRIGTKALAFWPDRFLADDDADALLALFERLVHGGKHLTLMLHLNHVRELETERARAAVARLRGCGVVLRSQGPLLRGVNDRAEDWGQLWQAQVRLGIVPYYLFVERDTGAHGHFAVPLERAHRIYGEAQAAVSGLARSARGPVMSTGPGKIELLGVAESGGERVFVLTFLQARDPAWVRRPFFARFDPEATWFDQLRPAGGAAEFFFERDYRALLQERATPDVRPAALATF